MTHHFRADAFAPIELKGDETGDPAEIVTKALDGMQASLNEKLAEIEKKAAASLTGRLDKLEAALKRPAIHTGNADEASIERKAFESWVRGHSIGADEQKALSITTTGGNGGAAATIPADMRTTIINKLVEVSPIRQLASSISMSTGSMDLPRLVDEVEPAPRAELGAAVEDNPTFDKIELKNFEMAVTVPVSRVTLEDNAVSLESFLLNHIIRMFGKKEGAWFVNGNGTTQAEGIMTSTAVPSLVTPTADLHLNDLIDTYYNLPTDYAGNGVWLMHRQTAALIRKLDDNTGSKIWQPSTQAGQPALLLGAPVREAIDMPLPTAGSYPIIFGDFSLGYTIGEHISYQAVRDDLTGWGNGLVKFNARRRVGGRVVVGDAFRKLRIKPA